MESELAKPAPTAATLARRIEIMEVLKEEYLPDFTSSDTPRLITLDELPSLLPEDCREKVVSSVRKVCPYNDWPVSLKIKEDANTVLEVWVAPSRKD